MSACRVRGRQPRNLATKRDAKSAKRRVLIELNISPLYFGHKVERFGERGRLENRTTTICRRRSREVLAQMSVKRGLMLPDGTRGESLAGEGWLGKSNRNPTFSMRSHKPRAWPLNCCALQVSLANWWSIRAKSSQQLSCGPPGPADRCAGQPIRFSLHANSSKNCL